MSNRPMLPPTEIPDLLRRFVPTSHEACIRSENLHVTLRTNDVRLLHTTPGVDIDGREVDGPEWTMVCDAEMVPEFREPLVIDVGTTSFVSFGRACYVAIDRTKNEIAGFISAGISDEDWGSMVLPKVLELFSDGW